MPQIVWRRFSANNMVDKVGFFPSMRLHTSCFGQDEPGLATIKSILLEAVSEVADIE